MILNNEILILNTGGTFNKYYDPIAGALKVSKKNNFIKDILEKSKLTNIALEGILYKDSLEINDKDRELLKEYIHKLQYNKVIVIHGTDTMDKSAEFIAKNIQNKTIVFTGAMKPYSIQNVEAVANLMTAYGYLLNAQDSGVFISMHGMVEEYQKLKKNRELGIFECQN
jgi:L-asparaginase